MDRQFDKSTSSWSKHYMPLDLSKWPMKKKYSKTCLNGQLYLKDNLYIKDTLQSPKLAFYRQVFLYGWKKQRDS